MGLGTGLYELNASMVIYCELISCLLQKKSKLFTKSNYKSLKKIFSFIAMKSSKSKEKVQSEKIFVWSGSDKTKRNTPSSSSLSPQPGPSSLVIPVIPEIDDIDIPTEIENLKISTSTTKENFAELQKQDFNFLEDVDLSLLTRFLRPLKELKEDKDEVWTVDSLMTNIFTEINAEREKEQNAKK